VKSDFNYTASTMWAAVIGKLFGEVAVESCIVFQNLAPVNYYCSKARLTGSGFSRSGFRGFLNKNHFSVKNLYSGF
jgi:hypothetical protein